MGVLPTSRAVRKLDDWLIDLIFEILMRFPIDGVRKWYLEDRHKGSIGDFDIEDYREAGYTDEEIAMIRGTK